MAKGVIIYYLCSNPSCSFSTQKIRQEQPVNTSSTKFSFKVISTCPKCKSEVELLNFISGEVTITEDKIVQKEEKKED